MIIDEIFLGGMLLIAIVWLADSLWRLSRGRPRLFRPWPDTGLYVLMTYATLSIRTWETRDLIAKIVFVSVVAVLAIVHFVGRGRAPVQS